jgi:hypothetical protein
VKQQYKLCLFNMWTYSKCELLPTEAGYSVLYSQNTFMHINDLKNSAVVKYIVACRPIAKQWLGEYRSLLGNARNSRRMEFSMWSAPRHLLYNDTVNTPLQQQMGCVFCVFRAKVLFWRQFSLPYGGGVEYLHHSSATRRRRRKGNPVTGGITGPPYN